MLRVWAKQESQLHDESRGVRVNDYWFLNAIFEDRVSKIPSSGGTVNESRVSGDVHAG